MKKCKHDHECERCIREEIARKESELSDLKKKLPQTDLNRILDQIEKQQKQPNYIPVPVYPKPYYYGPHGGWCACNVCIGKIYCGTSNLPTNTINAQYMGASGGLQAFNVAG